jgi:hypothetical protein
MSEARAEYIPCAAGNNLHGDVMVRRVGDLVEILGHPQMHFTAADATRLAVRINAIATAIQHEDPPRP